jgi:hypothetical protein
MPGLPGSSCEVRGELVLRLPVEPDVLRTEMCWVRRRERQETGLGILQCSALDVLVVPDLAVPTGGRVAVTAKSGRLVADPVVARGGRLVVGIVGVGLRGGWRPTTSLGLILLAVHDSQDLLELRGQVRAEVPRVSGSGPRESDNLAVRQSQAVREPHPALRATVRIADLPMFPCLIPMCGRSCHGRPKPRRAATDGGVCGNIRIQLGRERRSWISVEPLHHDVRQLVSEKLLALLGARSDPPPSEVDVFVIGHRMSVTVDARYWATNAHRQDPLRGHGRRAPN